MTAVRVLREIYDHCYRLVGEPFICGYCHDPADTIDHTVPLWFVEGNLDLLAAANLYKLPACGDCNARAGQIVDRTFLARRRRIASSLRRKHRAVLMTADWTDEEIEESGWGLRSSIRMGVFMQRHLLNRLRVLDSHNHPPGMPAFFFSHAQRRLLAQRAKREALVES